MVRVSAAGEYNKPECGRLAYHVSSSGGEEDSRDSPDSTGIGHTKAEICPGTKRSIEENVDSVSRLVTSYRDSRDLLSFYSHIQNNIGS